MRRRASGSSPCRAALGASRGRLVRQCLSESTVLGVCGGTLGAFFAAVGVGPFVAMWPGSLPRAGDIRFDPTVWLFTLILSLASSVLFGLAPALRIRIDSVERALRAGARSIVALSRALQRGYVIAEVALAVVLLVSAGMLGRTLLALSSLDPGVNVRNVLTAHVAVSPGALADQVRIRSAWQEVVDRAAGVAGDQSAALADIIPMRQGDNTTPSWTTPEMPPANQVPFALASTVTPDYLNVMGIPLRRGRFFDDHDCAGSEPVVVIDDTLARHAFGAGDAVGKRLWVSALGPVPCRIVGVVGHVRHWGLAGDDRSRVRDQIYYPFAQVPASLLRLFSSLVGRRSHARAAARSRRVAAPGAPRRGRRSSALPGADDGGPGGGVAPASALPADGVEHFRGHGIAAGIRWHLRRPRLLDESTPARIRRPDGARRDRARRHESGCARAHRWSSSCGRWRGGGMGAGRL